MDTHDRLPMGEVSRRSGFAASALRYYESQGLIAAERSRRWPADLPARRAAAAGVHPRGEQHRADAGGDPRGARHPARRADPDEGGLAPHLRATGATGSTSRSRRSSGCGTGSTRASGAAACPSSTAGSPTPATSPRRAERRGVPSTAAAPRPAAQTSDRRPALNCEPLGDRRVRDGVRHRTAFRHSSKASPQGQTVSVRCDFAAYRLLLIMNLGAGTHNKRDERPAGRARFQTGRSYEGCARRR